VSAANRDQRSPAQARKPSGAQRQQKPSGKARAWLALHRDCALDAMRRLRAQPFSSLMTLAVVAIALLLPSLLYVTGKNLAQFSDSLSGANQINAYLNSDLEESSARQLLQDIEQHPLVSRAEYISPEQAAADFALWSGLGDVVSSLNDNPLPASVLITPVDTRFETAAQIRDAFVGRAELALIQLDQEWLQRLETFLALAQRGVVALIVILALAVLFITGNSIRTIIASREVEIRVMNLIGATNSFIARPFLYTGLWLGLLGGLLAWLMLGGMLLLFRAPASNLLAFYGSQYQLYGLDLQATLVLLGGSALLGWLGARLSVSRHLTRF
jgi:cell division transport system permease protein